VQLFANGSFSENEAISEYSFDTDGNGTPDQLGSPSVEVSYATSGTFTPNVTVRDSAGRSATATLSVVVDPSAPTRPAPPTDLVATPGLNSAAISWSAPADLGGSGLVGYEVVDGNGAFLAMGPASPIRLTGLPGGVPLSIRVRTVTAAGDSVASVPVSVTPTGTDTQTSSSGVQRVAGADRIATAIAVSQISHPNPAEGPAAIVASAVTYADAIVAAPLAAARNAPVLLSGGTDLDPRVEGELVRLLAPGGRVFVIGGERALGPAIESRLAQLGFAVTRLAGEDRYITSTQVAQELGNPAKILVATGTNFPDALSAGAAAASTGSSVILTAGTSVTPQVDEYLRQRPGADLHAIGGPAATAVPNAVPVVGADRFQTAEMVARAFFPDPEVVGIASGLNFPDALAGGAHVGSAGGPLLLTDRDVVPAVTSDYLSDVSSGVQTAFIYGGHSVVSSNVEGEIGSVLSTGSVADPSPIDPPPTGTTQPPATTTTTTQQQPTTTSTSTPSTTTSTTVAASGSPPVFTSYSANSAANQVTYRFDQPIANPVAQRFGFYTSDGSSRYGSSATASSDSVTVTFAAGGVPAGVRFFVADLSDANVSGDGDSAVESSPSSGNPADNVLWHKGSPTDAPDLTSVTRVPGSATLLDFAFDSAVSQSSAVAQRFAAYDPQGRRTSGASVASTGSPNILRVTMSADISSMSRAGVAHEATRVAASPSLPSTVAGVA